MAYDTNMNRWIMASCRTWFSNHVLNNVKIFYEYTRHKDIVDQVTKFQLPAYAEFRLNGPEYRKITSNETWYDVDLNVLCSQVLNEGKSDEIENLIGSLAVCFTDIIPVFRYGDPTIIVNDSTLIGCLRLINEKDGQVKIARFGQANPDTLFTQASIDGQYRLKLTL